MTVSIGADDSRMTLNRCAQAAQAQGISHVCLVSAASTASAFGILVSTTHIILPRYLDKMMTRFGLCILALMSSTAPAFAQEVPTLTAEDVAALRSEVRQLREEVAALKAQKAAPAAPVPSWKGAPQFSDGASGFTFKPKGQIQADAGYIDLPASAGGTIGPVNAAFGASGINANNLGFNSRFRRINVGADGTLPGGFGYSFEFELSQAGVAYEDVILTYQRKDSPFQVKIGYQYPLQSLDQMTSSKFTSFMERAGNTDGFGYTRRMGVVLAYAKKDVTLSGGLFSEDSANTNFARTGWQASVRGTYAPMLGFVQSHFGLNYQHRVSPRDAQNVRYRQRPYSQLTDQRFIDTGRIAADGDDIVGIEAAAVYKSFHFAGEAQKLWVRGYNDPTMVFGINNGTGGASAFLNQDPSFISAYGEVGYFFTGETRGYKGGKWDRTKVLHPFDKGGWGAVQLNARVDYTNLQNRVGAGAITTSSLNYVNGGKQLGYEASLIWLPTDYVKFAAQYTHLKIIGGPGATAAFSVAQPNFYDNDYSSNAFTMRAQLDF
jgi:phosphate-selective porin OprO and OprP